MESTMTLEPMRSSYTFNWTITQFDIICPEEGQYFMEIKSECFTAGEDIQKKSKWFVSLRGKSGYIGCHLNLHSRTDEADFPFVRCSFTLSFGTDENKKSRNTVNDFGFGSDWGWNEFIEIAELYEMKETLLRNNTLQICVQMHIYREHRTTMTMLPLNLPKRENTLDILSADFLNIFNNKHSSDVEIACGSETFYAHKLILSARSKVLRAMLESEFQESTTSKVVITDIDTETFRALLLYIYSGKVELNDSSAYTELIHGAEKYDLPELKQHCFDELYKSATNETIGILAVTAENYNADAEMKKCIKEYCQRNITTLLTIPSFKNLVTSHPKAFF